MATIFVDNVRVGMRVSTDVYTSNGMKLFPLGTVLTKENLRMLRNHQVDKVTISDPIKAPIIQSAHSYNYSIIRSIPLFASFRSAHIEQLLEGSSVEHLQAKSIIFHEKDSGNSFHIIKEGSVKIFTQSNNGHEKILSIFKQGDSFGELSLLDGKPRSASAVTLERTELLNITRDSFMKVLQANFELAHLVMAEIARRISETEQHIHDLTLLDPQSRVIKGLIVLINQFGRRAYDIIELQMAIDYKELALMAGVGLQEYYEVLSNLEERRILRMHENYISIHLARLRDL
jgi:CRP/FNR family cyclic AMP-dependent transcriptional regulator